MPILALLLLVAYACAAAADVSGLSHGPRSHSLHASRCAASFIDRHERLKIYASVKVNTQILKVAALAACFW